MKTDRYAKRLERFLNRQYKKIAKKYGYSKCLCGHYPHIKRDFDFAATPYAILCLNCCRRTRQCSSVQEAINRWNDWMNK